MPDAPLQAPVRTLLQICPNDHPPFDDICRLYDAAAARLGMASTIVFLAPATGAPPPARPVPARPANVEWLDCEDLARTRAVADALRAHLGPGPRDLVLCHRYRAWAAWSRAGLAARRVVAIAHEFGFFRRRGRRLKARFGRGRIEFAGVSPAVVADLERAVGRALLLPNGIDASAIDWLTRDGARAALGVPAAGFVCGVLGRLHPKKRPLLALEGFRRAARPDWRLVFVGDGELGDTLAAAAGGGTPVTFTGFVPEARRYLRAFDVLLMTSADVEAFGMVALEAMAAGVPVVAPRAPGPASVLGDCAHYFEGEDPGAVAAALERAATAGGTVAARAAERAAREFSVDAVARRLDALAVARPRRDGPGQS